MSYKEFLESKRHTLGNSGFKANYIPDMAFNFQREIINRATKKGRMAVFADTGLGKICFLCCFFLLYRFDYS